VMISTAPLVTDLKLRFKHSPKVMSFRHYPRLLPDGADRTLTVKSLKADFSAAAERALLLAKSADADYLPGWCGPVGS
jgi:hypothetical protein